MEECSQNEASNVCIRTCIQGNVVCIFNTFLRNDEACDAEIDPYTVHKLYTYCVFLHLVCSILDYVLAEIIDCGWSPWVNGTCSITCGGEGVRVDTRTCDNPPPQNGGKDYNGSPNRTVPCFTCPCKH